MKRYIQIILSILLLTACGKKDFKVDFDIDGLGTQNLRFVYYSSYNEREGKIIETMAPALDGKLTLIGTSTRPTVVNVFTQARSYLCSFYVEPGDEMKVVGKYADPMLWSYEGNELSEELSSWMQANKSSLADSHKLNSAIAKYVKSNNDSEVSALLLMCHYNDKDDVLQKDSLWNKLNLDAKSEDMVNALTGANIYAEKSSTGKVIKSLNLYSKADTLSVVKFSDAKATVLYLWRDNDADYDKQISMLKRVKEKEDNKKIRIFDINLDMDTFAWKHHVRADSLKWERLWTMGGELNNSMKALAVPRSPYFIVIDSVGKQLYRGSDTLKLEKTIQEIIK